jgi:hypothetical protein
LIGGDLTDPENDGDDTEASGAGLNFNANFSASEEAGFSFDGGGDLHEAAFDVFDNLVGGGRAKWCCGSEVFPLWVQAELDVAHFLTHFTVASSNDTPGRDPRVWQILGSNDGENFDVIYSQDNSDAGLWDARNQVIRFDAGTDFDTQTTAYKIFRMNTDTTGSTAAAHFAVSEVEFFGQPIPEPSVFAMLAAALVGLVCVRRRR